MPLEASWIKHLYSLVTLVTLDNPVHELPLLKNAVTEGTSNSFTKLMMSKQSAKYASILPQSGLDLRRLEDWSAVSPRRHVALLGRLPLLKMFFMPRAIWREWVSGSIWSMVRKFFHGTFRGESSNSLGERTVMLFYSFSEFYIQIILSLYFQ